MPAELLFDEKKVYSTVNAQRLRVGSLCYLADNLYDLNTIVTSGKEHVKGVQAKLAVVRSIRSWENPLRFSTSSNPERDIEAESNWLLAYLVKGPIEIVPWDFETCPVHAGEVLRDKCNEEVEYLVTAKVKLGLSVDGVFNTYEEVSKKFVLSNGKPCGKESNV